jgi:hypothetical protein
LNLKFEKFAKKISNVPIFKVGVHNGRHYKDKDIDEMIENFNRLKEENPDFQLPIKVGHEDGEEKKAVGWMENLRRKGQFIVADFVELTDSIFEDIKNKGLKNRSIEIIPDFVDSMGKKLGKFISAIALLGTSLPAVNLPDIKFCLSDGQDTETVDFDSIEDMDTYSWQYQIYLSNEKFQENTKVQAVILSKSRFQSKDKSLSWVKSHDFRADKVDETGDSYHFRQREPEEFKTNSFRTIDVTEGVKAVVGKIKDIQNEKPKQGGKNKMSVKINMLSEGSHNGIDYDAKALKEIGEKAKGRKVTYEHEGSAYVFSVDGFSVTGGKLVASCSPITDSDGLDSSVDFSLQTVEKFAEETKEEETEENKEEEAPAKEDASDEEQKEELSSDDKVVKLASDLVKDPSKLIETLQKYVETTDKYSVEMDKMRSEAKERHEKELKVFASSLVDANKIYPSSLPTIEALLYNLDHSKKVEYFSSEFQVKSEKTMLEIFKDFLSSLPDLGLLGRKGSDVGQTYEIALKAKAKEMGFSEEDMKKPVTYAKVVAKLLNDRPEFLEKE